MHRVVIVRVKEKDAPKKKTWLQAVPSIITAIVALLGIVVSFLTYRSTSEDRAAQRAAARNDRFSRAIENLKDESLAIRMGALYELKNLGLEDDELQESIVRILGPFIREGIENQDLMLLPSYTGDLQRPNEDVFIACEIASLFWEQTKHSVSLEKLQAKKIDLTNIQFKGANLWLADISDSRLFYANFQGAIIRGAALHQSQFHYANLEGADLTETHLRGADFRQANLQKTVFQTADLTMVDLREVENLTIKQLLETITIDDTTLLDPDLRAEYDRLKAEQN